MQEKVGEKVKTNLKILIASVVTILISVSSCYVLAETLINSKDVVYEDNSNLAADNVQDAIDGTCTKIDTRLSGIEDNLYTIKKMSNSKSITSTTDWSYSGLSITLPANACCSINYYAFWNSIPPAGIMVSNSSTVGPQYTQALATTTLDNLQSLSANLTECTSTEITHYIWSKFYSVSRNSVAYNGFCTIKYK